MNKELKGISCFLWTIKILLVLGSLFAIIFQFYIDNGKMIQVSSPYFEVSNSLSEEISSDILRRLDLPDETNPIELEVNQVVISIPINTSFKVLMVIAILVVVGYLYFGLHIIGNLIIDLRHQKIFTSVNMLRVKRIGIMIILAPVLELILQIFFETWFSSNYRFQNLNITSEDTLGLPFYVIGALIYALGHVFDQGIKLQEENELTV